MRSHRFHPADRAWMEQALSLASLGEGTASPNPLVGCVLVRDERAVGWGYHEAAGKPHAESRAVEMAGSRARGATAYVNLEPCSHHGRTPPCADLLVEKGILRVVASVTDPNPQVNGRGFDRLRQAGVRVDLGLLSEAASRLNEPFLHWQATRRPFVTLKAAASLDGMLAARDGRSRWITGGPARLFAHRLRMRCDALLVGAGTVRRDDPALDVRLGSVRAERLRVVLAPSLDVDPASRVFGRRPGDPALPRIYAAQDLPDRATLRFHGRAEVVRVPTNQGRLDLETVLADLGRAGVQSLLVEGGGGTIASFLAAGLGARAALFLAPRLVGARGATPLVDGEAVESPDRGWRLTEPAWIPLGDDLLWTGRIRPPTVG